MRPVIVIARTRRSEQRVHLRAETAVRVAAGGGQGRASASEGLHQCFKAFGRASCALDADALAALEDRIHIRVGDLARVGPRIRRCGRQKLDATIAREPGDRIVAVRPMDPRRAEVDGLAI
jgi:hypothetical protein